jgi:hypothetical protein
MLIYVKSVITRKCPFSNKIIKPKTMLCLFNDYQYKHFVNYIISIFIEIIPLDLINKIIEFTNYKELIQRTGLKIYTNWSINNINNKINKKLTYLDLHLDSENDSSEVDTSDNDSSDGASMSDG